ncbi:MAG: penicillin-binding protein activator LpoB [Candidatus Cloacimonetes bacterium]|nr:penicillin-binding protein activator LpoB [Candidatus Cloacimonadota bacterium]
MRKVLTCITLFLIILLLMAGCGPGTRKVERISTDEVTDLSGRWNDTDSKLVAEQMIRDLLYRPWLDDFVMKNSSKPVVIVGTIRNLSSEHIQTDVFIKDIERELINSGKVKFVATTAERNEIRTERDDQQSYSSEETAKSLAQETGADFMLKGTINSNTDAIEGKSVVFYQVDLELMNIESNEKVWIGSKEIKKFITKAKTKW